MIVDIYPKDGAGEPLYVNETEFYWTHACKSVEVDADDVTLRFERVEGESYDKRLEFPLIMIYEVRIRP